MNLSLMLNSALSAIPTLLLLVGSLVYFARSKKLLGIIMAVCMLVNLGSRVASIVFTYMIVNGGPNSVGSLGTLMSANSLVGMFFYLLFASAFVGVMLDTPKEQPDGWERDRSKVS